MTRTFLLSVVSLLLFGGANAATPWWKYDNICYPSPATCYSNMGIGYFYNTSDSGSWDATSYCWGKKYVCPDAVKDPNIDERVALERNDIANTSVVNSQDFDLAKLNGDCFGARKTKSNGAMVSVNGSYVKVWCNGAIEDVNEDNIVENGAFTTTTQHCSDLAERGYVDVLNGKCYGKRYNTSEYAIQCNGDNATLIVLNGATDWDDNSDSEYITDTQANNYFQTLVTAAQNARAANNIVLNNN